MRTFAAIVLGILLTGPSTAQVSLTGAGSTFVAPIMDKWIAEYVKGHPGITITYLPNGSGAGIAQTLHGMLDFGGTDAPRYRRPDVEGGDQGNSHSSNYWHRCACLQSPANDIRSSIYP
jgi:ABC-type phosphate transport system substrate-binding protein